MNSHFPAMLFRHSEDREKNPAPARLSELEIEAIEMFINFLRIIGLQKSVGEIYGLLFVSSKPLSMDDITNRLDIALVRPSRPESVCEDWAQLKLDSPWLAAIASLRIKIHDRFIKLRGTLGS